MQIERARSQTDNGRILESQRSPTSTVLCVGGAWSRQQRLSGARATASPLEFATATGPGVQKLP